MIQNHFQLVVIQRIADHQAEVQRKEDETRERIRAEEQEKAEREAREKVAAEQAAEQRRQFEERLENSQQVEDARQAEMAGAVLAMRAASPETAARHATMREVVLVRGSDIDLNSIKPRTDKPVTPPTLAPGEISTRLGFNVTSAFLATLGFEATTVKAAKLFHSEDFPAICRALIEHIESVCEVQTA